MIARARAIENRRFIARCANSGISGLISLTGESVSELPQYEQAGIKVEVPAITEISIYSKYGDFIGKISFVFVLISIIYAKYSKINITQGLNYEKSIVTHFACCPKFWCMFSERRRKTVRKNYSTNC
jgi:hypothetical protein